MNPAEPRAKLLDRPDLDAEYLKLFRAVLRDGREDVARRALHRAILCGPRFGRPYEVFGSALCRGFGNTGRVVDGQQPMATTETKAPIFVFGSSHARSFSDRDRFAPFMMGSANHVCFLTEELAKRTTGIVDEHLARTPEGGTAILVLSNCDCITLDNELEAEVEAEIAGDEAARENQLVAGTLRFGLALAELTRGHPNKRLFVFNASPMPSERGNRLAKLANGLLEPICRSLEIAFIDVFDRLVLPSTGLLDPKMAVAPGDEHLSRAFLSVLWDALTPLVGELSDESDFAWNAMFRFQLTNGHETRIWTEPYIGPENVVHSANVARSAIIEKVSRIVAAHCRLSGAKSLAVLGAGEGALPLTMPFRLLESIVAVDVSRAKAAMAYWLAKFARRHDVSVYVEDEIVPCEADVLVDLSVLCGRAGETTFLDPEAWMQHSRDAFVIVSRPPESTSELEGGVQLSDALSERHFGRLDLVYSRGGLTH